MKVHKEREPSPEHSRVGTPGKRANQQRILSWSNVWGRRKSRQPPGTRWKKCVRGKDQLNLRLLGRQWDEGWELLFGSRRPLGQKSLVTATRRAGLREAGRSIRDKEKLIHCSWKLRNCWYLERAVGIKEIKCFFLNIDGKYPLRERYLMMEERGELLQWAILGDTLRWAKGNTTRTQIKERFRKAYRFLVNRDSIKESIWQDVG